MQLPENTLFDFWPWTRGQGHTKCCPIPSASWDLCTCTVWSWYVQRLRWDILNKNQSHTKCCPVPYTSYDRCICKVWSCYVQRFRRRCIYKKRDDGRTDGPITDLPLYENNTYPLILKKKGGILIFKWHQKHNKPLASCSVVKFLANVHVHWNRWDFWRCGITFGLCKNINTLPFPHFELIITAIMNQMNRSGFPLII